jgi:hypothetical protein
VIEHLELILLQDLDHLVCELLARNTFCKFHHYELSSSKDSVFSVKKDKLQLYSRLKLMNAFRGVRINIRARDAWLVK